MPPYSGGPDINATAEYRFPRDTDGNKTHNMSTVVGSHVLWAIMLGYAIGIATGATPKHGVDLGQPAQLTWQCELSDKGHNQSSFSLNLREILQLDGPKIDGAS